MTTRLRADFQGGIEVVAAVTEQLGLDRPLGVRFVEYLGGLFVGDLGVSYGGEPVATAIWRALPMDGCDSRSRRLEQKFASGFPVKQMSSSEPGALLHTSVVLQRLQDEAPANHFTLDRLVASPRKRSYGMLMLVLALFAICTGYLT